MTSCHVVILTTAEVAGNYRPAAVRRMVPPAIGADGEVTGVE